jgi:hypothetical protein
MDETLRGERGHSPTPYPLMRSLGPDERDLDVARTIKRTSLHHLLTTTDGLAVTSVCQNILGFRLTIWQLCLPSSNKGMVTHIRHNATKVVIFDTGFSLLEVHQDSAKQTKKSMTTLELPLTQSSKRSIKSQSSQSLYDVERNGQV